MSTDLFDSAIYSNQLLKRSVNPRCSKLAIGRAESLPTIHHSAAHRPTSIKYRDALHEIRVTDAHIGPVVKSQIAEVKWNYLRFCRRAKKWRTATDYWSKKCSLLLIFAQSLAPFAIYCSRALAHSSHFDSCTYRNFLHLSEQLRVGM